jgi:hypothetical protein
MKSRNNSLLIFILMIIFEILSFEIFAQATNSTLLISNNLDSLKSDLIIPEKEVLLNSSPQDAYVFYKDSLIGNTPLFVQKSFSKLTLRKSGYDDTTILFDNIIPGKTVPMNFNGQEKEKSFFEKDIFKILTAGIVVLGGTTAYFKLKADNKFEEYEFSGNGELLDDTRKYDLISGITFTALQINFGLLLYYFLIE